MDDDAPRYTTPKGHGDEGHHDGKICLGEWKAFFDWATEHGEGEMYLAKVEKAAAELQKKFNARVEAVFKIIDTDHSGDLSMPKMELIFGEETHEFWEDMDGEAGSSVTAIAILCISFPLTLSRLFHFCA